LTDQTPDEQPAAEAAPLAASDPAPIAASAAPEPEAPEPARRLQPRAIGLGVATGVVAVALILLALMVFAPGVAPIKLGAVRDAQAAAEQTAVEDVATRFSEALYSFNYKTIDADLERIRDASTRNFSRELNEVLGEVDVFKKAIVDARGESSGTVQGADVREVDDDTATARVFVVQTIRNKKNPQARQQFSAVELTLVRTSAGWRVDDVQQLAGGAPGGEQ
jgi:Mce-associated membrane protein